MNNVRDRKFIFSTLSLAICLVGYLAVPRALDWWDSRDKRPIQYHRVPILLFHEVDGPGQYAISSEQFRYYMDAIRKSGVRVIPLRTLLEHVHSNRLLHEPSLVITIDDDYKNIARVAAPILREYGYPATFFFYVSDIQSNPRWGTAWDDLRRLKAEGFDIQNHSYTHTIFHVPLPGESPAAYEARLHREIVSSREAFETNLPDHEIYAFAYPMGYYSRTLRNRLHEAGYSLLLTTDARPVDLTAPFEGTLHRFTIQRYYGRDPRLVFDRQLRYALQEYESIDHSVAAHESRNDSGEQLQ